MEEITFNNGSLHQVIRNVRMRKDVNKDSFKVGVKCSVGTGLGEH